MKNRNTLLIFPFITVGILLFLTSRCKKEDNVIIAPVITTDLVSNITKSTALCGGDINSDGGAEVTVKGLCWSELSLPTTDDYMNMEGTGTGSFTSSMTNLTAGTLYYVRAYATNSVGTSYGIMRTFATLPDVTYGSVSDVDGNIYKTVQIGAQIWMAENLKTTHYNDGTPIPSHTNWTDSTAAYCWYNNNLTYKEIYGALYNWHAFDTARNGGKNICPSGWHIPHEFEWKELIEYLGGYEIAGNKLKESGNSHWYTYNINSTNSTGFSALPGGRRYVDGFSGIGEEGYWWTYDTNTYGTFVKNMSCWDEGVSGGIRGKDFCGLSIRCIKD